MMFEPVHNFDRSAALAIAAVLTLAFTSDDASAAEPQGRATTITTQAGEQSASLASGDANTGVASDPVRARIEALPRQAVEEFYLSCSRAAASGRLGNGGVQTCSIGYDVLLKRHFGNDYLALLSWSQSHAHSD